MVDKKYLPFLPTLPDGAHWDYTNSGIVKIQKTERPRTAQSFPNKRRKFASNCAASSAVGIPRNSAAKSYTATRFCGMIQSGIP